MGVQAATERRLKSFRRHHNLVATFALVGRGRIEEAVNGRASGLSGGGPTLWLQADAKCGATQSLWVVITQCSLVQSEVVLHHAHRSWVGAILLCHHPELVGFV